MAIYASTSVAYMHKIRYYLRAITSSLAIDKMGNFSLYMYKYVAQCEVK